MLIDIFVNCNWVNTRWQCYSTHNQYIEQHNNNRTTQITAQRNNNRKTITQLNDNYILKSADSAPTCEFNPGICLTTEEKARKNLSHGSQRMLLPITKTPTQWQ